jgi:hypothetical protein
MRAMSLWLVILWALYPANPFMRAAGGLRAFIEENLRWALDPKIMASLTANPRDIALRLFEANVGAIETFIHDLIFYRAWVILGRPRIGVRPKLRYRRSIAAYGLLGQPRSFRACLDRLDRACDLFCSIERLARRRALKLRRLLDARALQLETIHRPIESAPIESTTAIVCAYARALAPLLVSVWSPRVPEPP